MPFTYDGENPAGIPSRETPIDFAGLVACSILFQTLVCLYLWRISLRIIALSLCASLMILDDSFLSSKRAD